MLYYEQYKLYPRLGDQSIHLKCSNMTLSQYTALDTILSL